MLLIDGCCSQCFNVWSQQRQIHQQNQPIYRLKQTTGVGFWQFKKKNINIVVKWDQVNWILKATCIHFNKNNYPSRHNKLFFALVFDLYHYTVGGSYLKIDNQKITGSRGSLFSSWLSSLMGFYRHLHFHTVGFGCKAQPDEHIQLVAAQVQRRQWHNSSSTLLSN